MLFNYAELKTHCQYYPKRLSLLLCQSQPDVTQLHKEFVRVHFSYFL